MALQKESLSSMALRLLPLAEAYAERHASTLLKELGSGGSASVYLLDNEKNLTALKVYDPTFLDDKNGPSERRRIDLQRKLIGHDCPAIVNIINIILEGGTCFIEMEYVDWKNLKEAIPNTPPEKVENLFYQLSSSVQFLDNLGLVHRDIKPENIMVDSEFNNLKLIDFGVIRETGNDEDPIDGTDHGLRRPFIASAQYSSPEYLFRLKEPSVEMWRALTIYQLGGVLHDLIVKKPLFYEMVQSENKFTLAMAVLTEIPKFNNIPVGLTPWAIIASNCLVKDPDLRLALVNIADMVPSSGQGAERLKQLTNQRKALRSAKDAKDHKEAQIKHTRSNTLRNLQNAVRQKLISAVDKAYGITIDIHEDTAIKFEFEMEHGIKLQVTCHFVWLSAFTPLVSNTTLTASFGLVPNESQLTHKAIGQMVAGPTLEELFVDSMLNSICDIVASASMHLALGEAEAENIHFVDAVLLTDQL